MEERGVIGRENESLIKHWVRDEKLKLSPEQLRAVHKQHAEQFGNEPARVVAEASHHLHPTLSPDKTQQRSEAAVTFARERLSERSAVFEHFEVIRDALRHTHGRARLPDIQAELAKQKEQSKFLEVQHIRLYAAE